MEDFKRVGRIWNLAGWYHRGLPPPDCAALMAQRDERPYLADILSTPCSSDRRRSSGP